MQLHGGIQAGDQQEALANRADEVAGEFNRLRGEDLAVVHRPFAQRFPLLGDVGYGLLAGHLPGGRPVLGLPGNRRLVLLRFGDEGEFLGFECQGPGCDGDELEDRLRDGFGFKFGLIQVREFTTNADVPRRRAPWFFTSDQQPRDEDIALCLWPYGSATLIESPDTPPAITAPQPILPGRRRPTHWSRRDMHAGVAPIHRWLDDGSFMIDCWNDYWAGPDGQIHSS
jgi:hypothetical protein